MTGGGERLASGALDGSVVVWSLSAEGKDQDQDKDQDQGKGEGKGGLLVPVVTYGGLCHPYRLVAVGR